MNPPKRALAFLRWFCREDYLEEIEGDLTEIFVKQSQSSPHQAKWKFTWSVIRYFRPGFIRAFRNVNQSAYGMYISYFKIGWRNLLRNQGYSFINIFGLALGMTVAMLIGLWVYDELSYNTYHKNYDQIAQVWVGGTDPETQEIVGHIAVQQPAAFALKNNYSHYFKRVVLAWWPGDNTLSLGDRKFIRHGQFIEAASLEMFSLDMLQGSYNSLNDMHSIILSRSTAEAIFGKDDPMNKTLKIDNRMEVQVTGVYEDIPRNSKFGDLKFFAPWPLWVTVMPWIKQSETNWDNRSFNIYVQLQPGIQMEEANAAVYDFYFKNLPKDLLKQAEKWKGFMQLLPMNTWHLYSELKNGKPTTGRIVFVWLFGSAGGFVLLLACINFINLSTARSEKRAKETGVRKAVGSMKSQLVAQFLSESFLVVVVAFILAAGFTTLSLSWFNELADKDISIPFSNPVFWSIVMIFIFITGFMAGLYPAFYLSSFQPVKVLKGAFRSGRLAALPRKILVVVQYTVSVMLIIGTIVVYQQIQHARNRPAGYDRESMISFMMTDPAFKGKQEVARQELFNTGMVEEVAFSSSPLTQVWSSAGGFSWQGKDPAKDTDFDLCYVSHTFGEAVKWKLVQGKDFDLEHDYDSSAIIITESAAQYMNLDNPVGELITHEEDKIRYHIVGVVKDVIMGSPYEPVKQTFFIQNRYDYSNIHIRLKQGTGTAEAVAKVERVFKQIVPTASIDYRFADDAYSYKFSQEERIGKLSGIFAVLAIVISSLGLFGLASFVAEQRTKEMGIRKVLGASVANLWRMLSKDFIILVIISCGIAIPVAYYYMDLWLEKYTYHTGLSWWIFLVTVLGALTLTLLTVSFQAVRAAMMNPVNSLKSE